MVNPFAERLTFLDEQTRTRRDHRKYLALIRTIALLHQHQRPVLRLPRPGQEPVAYIEATIADIAAANRLAHAVLGTTLDELPPQTRRLLKLVWELIAARAQAEALETPRGALRLGARSARGSGWGDTQLRGSTSAGWRSWNTVLSRREAGRVVYELAWDGEGADGAPFLMGLIDTDALAIEQAGNKK